MPTSAYKTKDGHINVAASGEGMWAGLCKAIGREDMLASPDFKGGKKRAENRKELNAAIEEALVKKTGAEWIEILNKAGIPCGPIFLRQALPTRSEHLGIAATVEHRSSRKRSSEAASSHARRRASRRRPPKREHNDEVLKELIHRGGDLETQRRRSM